MTPLSLQTLRILAGRPPWSDAGSDAILHSTVLIFPLAAAIATKLQRP